jgi:multidrug resistance efflux pump
LSFEKSGTVSDILVETGDIVSPGALLVSLSNADIRADILEAKANVAAAQASLEGLLGKE